MEAWHPIESAPRDGTPVLLFWPEGNFDLKANDYAGGHSPAYAVMAFNEGSWESHYIGDSFHGEPTLWQAITPPEMAQGCE